MIYFAIGEIEFDDELFAEKVEQVKRIGARRVGFQTREIAMNSITDGAGPSRPGQPPHGHTGFLKRFINYDYDSATSSVVIGAKLLPRRSKDAVQATEQGGRATNVKGRVIKVAARPFMAPAFASVNRSSVPEVFANTFR